MRAEVERAYQGGGLAAATEEDETFLSPVIPVDEIVARTTGPGPTPSLASLARQAAGERERQIIQNRDDAMARLRAGREAIASRRATQTRRDESARWLAFAQGMLAPTRTGGFGETLGTTAGLLRQEMEISREHEADRLQEEMLLAEQEADIQKDYLDQLQTEARIASQGYRGEYSRRRPIGAPTLIEHPEDPSRNARVQPMWDPDIPIQAKDANGQPMFDANGDPVMTTGDVVSEYIDAPGPDGSIPFAISREDTQRRRDIEFQTGLAGAEADRINNDIMAGREAWPMLQKYERTMALMKEVDAQGRGTGGYVELLQRMAEWFGVDTQEVTEMGELRNRLGQAVLNGLKHFPGQISEGERMYMERLETGLAKPLGVNMAILEEGLRIERARHRRGVMAARKHNFDLDLMAMGVNPDAPPGTAPAGSIEGARQQVPGSTRDNPIVVGPGVPMPAAGTWIQLPNGEVKRWWGPSGQE